MANVVVPSQAQDPQQFLDSISPETKQTILYTFFESDGYTLKVVSDAVRQTIYNKYGEQLTINIINAYRTINKPTTSTSTSEPVMDLNTGKVFTKINSDGVIKNIKQKVTETNWSNKETKLINFYTSSTQIQSNYFLNVYDVNPQLNDVSNIQFTISYGNVDGKGGVRIDSGSSDSSFTPTKVIYSQYRNFLLGTENDKFLINNTPTDSIFIIDIKRERSKQNLDVGNWELNLNGTLFTDDSTIISNPDVKEGGVVYNIVSGSLNNGVHLVNSSSIVYGLIYPEHGLFIFDANKLNTENIVYVTQSINTNANNHVNLLNSLNSGSNFQSRNEQVITSQMYFIRLNNKDYNFTNNPTFVQNSVGDLRFDEMINNPTVYITGIGLYNDNEELLAIAKLSKPIMKTFETEPLIRIKLDY